MQRRPVPIKILPQNSGILFTRPLHVLLSTALTRGWYGYGAGGEVVRFQEGAGFGALVLLPHQEHADRYITFEGKKNY
jgi:hypothetical protein